MAWVQCRPKGLDRMAEVTGLDPMGKNRLGLEWSEGEVERFRVTTYMRWVALRVGSRTRKVGDLAFSKPTPWIYLAGERQPVITKKVRGLEAYWVDSLGILRHWPTLRACFPKMLRGSEDPWKDVQRHLVMLRTGLVQFDRRIRDPA